MGKGEGSILGLGGVVIYVGGGHPVWLLEGPPHSCL